MFKVGIIGLGHVGRAIAFNLINKELVDELAIYDINKEILIANKLDLEQGGALNNNITKINIADFAILNECDILINTASSKILSPDRLTELKENKKIVKEIFKNFKNYKGIIINVSNPCDIISKLILDETNIDKKRIFSSGTLLDTIRFKMTLANHYNISPKDVFALVVGEHGESQVLCYDEVKIKNGTLFTYLKKNNLNFDKKIIDQEVIKSGANIFYAKGTTEYGIAGVVSFIIKQIKEDTNAILPLSAPYIIDGKLIYISHLVKINKLGIEDVLMNLSLDEEEAFKSSALKLSKLLYLN